MLSCPPKFGGRRGVAVNFDLAYIAYRFFLALICVNLAANLSMVTIPLPDSWAYLQMGTRLRVSPDGDEATCSVYPQMGTRLHVV